MNIERLRRRYELLSSRHRLWSERLCWFHTVDHNHDFKSGVKLLLLVLYVLAIFITGCLTESWLELISANYPEVSFFGGLALFVGLLSAFDPVVGLLFNWLVRQAESNCNFYEQRQKMMLERLTQAETIAANQQSLLEEWAGVPDGAIMPARLEAELADRGLSAVDDQPVSLLEGPA